jgi:hypothetical protein
MNEPELPSNEELHQALKRIEMLEEFVATNRKRIKDTRAITVLLAFFLPAFIFSGEAQFGEKNSINIKSRDIDMGDLVSLCGFGLAAVGAISYEDVLAFLKKSKG